MAFIEEEFVMFVGDGRHPLDKQFRVGVFFGIPLYLHIMLLFFFGIYVLTSLTHPVRLFFPLIVMFSVYLHELGHALSSAAFGNRPRRIVLHMFGGVAEVPPGLSSRKQLWVIAWGPLVSLMLSLVGFIMMRIPGLSSLYGVYFIGSYLFTINLVLFVFNILPIYPLDGGQFLRQLLTLKRGQTSAVRYSLPWSMLLVVLLGVYSLLAAQTFALVIAVMVFMVNYQEYKRWEHLFRGQFWQYLWPFHGRNAKSSQKNPGGIGDKFFVWWNRSSAEKLMRRADEEGIHKLDPKERKMLEHYLDAKIRVRRTRYDVN